ncbi:hypothetical protein CCP3SC15_300030 [Gammaproteobacteria bacterium]
MKSYNISMNDDDTLTLECYGDGLGGGSHKKVTCTNIDEIPDKLREIESMAKKEKPKKKGNKATELKAYLAGEDNDD